MAGRSGIRIPANSPVIAGVRCAEGEEKELSGGATTSAGERCGERAVWGRPGRDTRASRAWRAGRMGACEGGRASVETGRAEEGCEPSGGLDVGKGGGPERKERVG